MKFALLVCLLFIIACGGNDSSKNYNESRELVPNPEGYQKDTFPSDTFNNSVKKDSSRLTRTKYSK